MLQYDVVKNFEPVSLLADTPMWIEQEVFAGKDLKGFRREAGPFTLVPLPRRRSSLVFVVDPGEVARLSPLSDTVDKPHVGGPRPRESCRRGVTLPL